MIHRIAFPGLGLSLTVNRVAFWVFGIPVYWYGLLIGLGMVLAICYGMRESRRKGLGQDDLLNMILLAVPVAIVCARLYYVIFRWELYQTNPLSVLDIRSGGLAIYGGIIGACLAIFFYCRVKHCSLGLVLDILSVGLLIGQAVGRWGNFVNGEAFGSFTDLPWAMTIREGSKVVAFSVHPTFLYESVWNAVGIVVLLVYGKACRFRGERFCGYLVWYGLGRVWIEGLRADSLYLGPLRVSQLLAAVTVLAGVILIFLGRRRKYK